MSYVTKLTMRQALRLLTTVDEWYEWLWGEDTPPDKAPPQPTEGAGASQ